jgi:hypothetical protein
MKRTASTLTLILALLTLVVTGAQFMECGRANSVQVQTVQSSTLEPQFDVDLVYAYVQGGSYGTFVFNVTRVSDLPLSSESTTEVYKVEIFSDGQLIGSKAVGWSIGKSMSMDIAMSFTMSLHSFYTSKIYGLQRVSIFFEPINPNLVEPISLSIKRLGWITVDGDSVRSNLLGDEVIQQFQLEKFENGFLYNALVPTDQLSQIDLLRPSNSSNLNSTSPSPSPSQKPTSSPEPQNPEPFPTTLAIASVVSITVIGISLVICFVKFKKREVEL